MSDLGEDVLGAASLTPAQVTICSGWSRLTVDHDGAVPSELPYGLFCANTRLLSGWRLLIDGRAPERTLAGQTTADHWYGVFRARDSTQEGDLPEGTIPRGSLELRIHRRVAGGLREEWALTNYANEPRRVTLELELEASIADANRVSEPAAMTVDGKRLRFERRFGVRRRTPSEELGRELGALTPHDGDEVRRGVVLEADAEITPLAGGLRVIAEVPPRGDWKLTLLYHPIIDGRELAAPDSMVTPLADDDPIIETGNSLFNLVVRQARIDLKALELPVPFVPEAPRTISAGVPIYIGMFGRDSLTAAWQGALFSRRWMEGALSRLEKLQTDRYDAFREMEPGRFPHERRLSPSAALGERPHELYYGDVTTPPFWVVTLAGAWSWCGDAVLERHSAAAERCMAWIERELERGGGLVWDFPIHGGATRNHGWKDSGDAIVDGRGRVRTPPLALIEVQGYCHLALLSFAMMLAARGHLLRARHYQKLAAELRQRVDERFWMEAAQYPAIALDSDGAPVDAITSNPGHALGCGLILRERVPAVVRRLLAPDLFSGWGVRTLSSENPAYDPFSYHRGSVWPVENATIAGALALYGFSDEAEQVIEAQFLAATRFEQFRLPEVFGGQPRDADHPLPGVYPGANPLQAWSASAPSLMLQTLLGLRALAPLHLLLVRPRLPAWLREIVIRDLAVGDARVDLRFWRDDRGRQRWKILRKRGRLAVHDQTTWLDLNARWPTHLVDGLALAFH